MNKKTKQTRPTTKKRKPKTYGKIHPKNSMFLHQSHGSARCGKLSYQLLSGWGTGVPLVRSNQTDKVFSLDWSDIVTLAVKKGIDQ